MQKIIPAIKNFHRRCLGVKKQEQGFTLVEIVIAVIIMGLAYVVILQSFSLSTRNIAKVEAIRNSLLEYALEFDQQSFAQRLGDEDAVEMNESVFMEGSIYQLVLVSDESENFMTLRLEKF
jgi:prepilin-type N-terminal cleavage/methylation domain-containing protein